MQSGTGHGSPVEQEATYLQRCLESETAHALREELQDSMAVYSVVVSMGRGQRAGVRWVAPCHFQDLRRTRRPPIDGQATQLSVDVA
ncbi:hypothetical protein HPB50_015062 [Hyalomma asiaticum]|uniref:Uncharacterized protein n=1 Tax=Hyalomma asiaticum TaxID=266040 RepID=A0ACB7TIZ1_HYAAI|nr:hypothetical protein HPB50_015062 [Hyalomma asiaticum]